MIPIPLCVKTKPYNSAKHNFYVSGIFRCNSNTKMIGVNEFMQFLNGTQRDPRLNEILHPYAKSHNVQNLIEQYEKKKEYVNRHLLSFDAFLRYLMGDDNPIIAASKLEISNPESMEHPLAHYFINSSHNTYLTGMK